VLADTDITTRVAVDDLDAASDFCETKAAPCQGPTRTRVDPVPNRHQRAHRLQVKGRRFEQSRDRGLDCRGRDQRRRRSHSSRRQHLPAVRQPSRRDTQGRHPPCRPSADGVVQRPWRQHLRDQKALRTTLANRHSGAGVVGALAPTQSYHGATRTVTDRPCRQFSSAPSNGRTRRNTPDPSRHAHRGLHRHRNGAPRTTAANASRSTSPFAAAVWGQHELTPAAGGVRALSGEGRSAPVVGVSR
jgi:hypothetical protein